MRVLQEGIWEAQGSLRICEMRWQKGLGNYQKRRGGSIDVGTKVQGTRFPPFK